MTVETGVETLKRMYTARLEEWPGGLSGWHLEMHDLIPFIIANLEHAEHLEETLRLIASCEPHGPDDVVHIARIALHMETQP